MKKWVSLLLAFAMVWAMAGCSGEKTAEKKATDGASAQKNVDVTPVVGICMPWESDYWAQNAQLLVQSLEEQGCRTELRWADNDVQVQVRQAGDLIASMVDCLIVAPVDSVALITVEEEAGRVGIPVVAYERLLMDTDSVSAHVTFDYRLMGQSIGTYILQARQLETAAAEGRSYTIEFFMGSADDNNALLMHAGILEVLGPYLNSGVLVCRTGRTTFEDTYTLRWDTETAKAECAAYLAEFYTPEEPLSICCAASDELALGCITALEEAGYTQENWPLITGHGAKLESVRALITGKQAMTVYKDSQAMVSACAESVLALLEGKTPVSNDPEAGDNHVTMVPTYVCPSTVVDAANYQDVLITSGIYTEADLH